MLGLTQYTMTRGAPLKNIVSNRSPFVPSQLKTTNISQESKELAPGLDLATQETSELFDIHVTSTNISNDPHGHHTPSSSMIATEMDCTDNTVQHCNHNKVESGGNESEGYVLHDKVDCESEGGWITEDDGNSHSSGSDSEVELPPGLPSRTGHSMLSERLVSSNRRFQRQHGMLVPIKDHQDDETRPELTGYGTPATSVSPHEDYIEEYATYCGKPTSSGLNYAFPNHQPTGIEEIVDFWEVDFQTGHVITPRMGSWESMGIAPQKDADLSGWKRFMVYKKLYYRWIQCHRNERRWCKQYRCMSLHQILRAPSKSQNKVKANEC